jgi:SAM-dependent methyltransferase
VQRTDASDAGTLRAILYEWECCHVNGRTVQDLAKWLELARSRGGPVLELACGTGRLTVPIAAALAAGQATGGGGRVSVARAPLVVGLDSDPGMLRVARARSSLQQAGSGRGRGRGYPVFVAGDMRRFALQALFATVLVAYNSIQLLTDADEMVACLREARRHICDQGVIGLEVTDFQAGVAEDEVPETALHTGPLSLDSSTEAVTITLTGSLEHDTRSRVSRYHRRYTSPLWVLEDDVVLRSLDYPELCGLLHRAGLRPVSRESRGRAELVVAERL